MSSNRFTAGPDVSSRIIAFARDIGRTARQDEQRQATIARTASVWPRLAFSAS
jgi:hypothetical protein